MDLFANRYGWTKETVHALPVFDFLGYLAAARAEQRKEFRQQMKASAFTGWQIQNIIGGMLSSEKNPFKGPNFLEYSENLGLLSDEEKQHLKMFKQMERIRRKQEEKAALAKADNIIQLDRQNRKGG